MTDRRCGYCRSMGHNSGKCPIRLGQIDAVKKHLYGERKGLHKLLLDNGLGVGAIIHRRGDDGPSVIRSHERIFNHYCNQFVEFRKIKYQKSVRTFLKSYTGVQHCQTDDTNIKFQRVGTFYIVCSPLDNLATDNYALFEPALLPNPPAGSSPSNSYWNRQNVEILAPSDETDVGESAYSSTEQLPTNLGKDKFGYGIRITPAP